MKQLTAFILIAFHLGSYAQYCVEGLLLDEKQNVSPYTNLVSLDGKQVVQSDANGAFKFENVSEVPFYFKIQSIDFIEDTVKVIPTSGEKCHHITVLLKNNKHLEEMVVSGDLMERARSKSPVPIEVYDKEFFRSNPNPSVFESMQNVNGVRPQINCNVCNTGDIHINGLEGPYTMVLIDGLPIVSGLSTVYGLNGIPQSLIERVEIVKGPASTLYGSEAVGGIINVITKRPEGKSLLSVDSYGTSWLESNTDLSYVFGMGKKSHSMLGVNYFNYSNPIDNNDDNFTDVTLQDRISIFNKWTFDRKNNRVFSLAGRYVYEDRWGGEMNWTPEYRGGDQIYGESIYTSRWEAFGSYQLPLDEIILLQFSANGHHQNSVYGDMPYIAQQNIYFGQLRWHKEIGTRHNLLSGLSYRYTYYDDNTPATADVSHQYLPGAFLQDEIILNGQNTILAGVRMDYNSKHGKIFSPRLNYKWADQKGKNTLRLSIGNGYRVANVFTEDHAALTGARDVVFAEELKPETSWNANLNWVNKIYLEKQRLISIDASLFYTHFFNRIIPDYDSEPNLIIYENLRGKAISKGIALNIDYIGDKLNASLGTSIMDVSTEENGIKTRPILTENVSGVWTISYSFDNNWQLDYTGNLYGPMRLPLLGELDNRDEYSDWYSIQNIQIRKEFPKKNIEVYGGVKNLLNFTPPANSIARAFDPFDRGVQFNDDGQVLATPNNPNALSFDPSYVYAPNQGIRLFMGLRVNIGQ